MTAFISERVKGARSALTRVRVIVSTDSITMAGQTLLIVVFGNHERTAAVHASASDCSETLYSTNSQDQYADDAFSQSRCYIDSCSGGTCGCTSTSRHETQGLWSDSGR